MDLFVAQYENPVTSRDYRAYLVGLFTAASIPVAELRAGHVTHWAWTAPARTGKAPASNTARVRLTVARTFLRWCLRHGHITNPAIIEDLGDAMKRAPRTYGKAQSPNPARFLTPTEVARLVGACRDGTDAGLRDEVIVRLGVSSGMRASEMANLRWGHVDVANRSIRWTGKKHRPRQTRLGEGFRAVLTEYADRTAEGLGTPPTCQHPVIVARSRARGGKLQWGKPIATTPGDTLQVWLAVTRRAALAGLGHVTPHDLRRTCASILHRAIDQQGGHLYDLLDVQKVLGHADPAITMRCYLDPMDTGVFDRAADTLDL